MAPSRGSASLLLFLSLALSSSATLAQGTPPAANPAKAAAAEQLFQEGRRLLVAGEYAKACDKFAESQRLDPGTGTLLNLGDCYERIGKTASAWATFGEAATAAKTANEPAKEAVARQRKDALEPHLARVTISVPPASIVSGLLVRRDGTEVTKASWGVPLPIDPGEHVIDAAAPGKRPWTRRVSVAADQKVTVTVEPLAAIAENGAPVASSRPPEPERASPPPSTTTNADADRGSGQRTAGVILGGLGLVGVGVGAVYGLSAKSTYDGSAPYCDAAGYCDRNGVDRRDKAMRQATVSTIAFGIGAAALVGGVTLWLTAPHAESPSTAVRVGPGSFHVEATW